MVTARLLTNCSLYAIYILTPERISQGHVQNGRRATFSWPTLYIIGQKLLLAMHFILTPQLADG